MPLSTIFSEASSARRAACIVIPVLMGGASHCWAATASLRHTRRGFASSNAQDTQAAAPSGPPSNNSGNSSGDNPASAQAANGNSGVVNAGEVSAGAKVPPSWKRELPTKKQIFKSGQTIKVLDRDQIEAAGPAAGAAQALEYAPGVHINGYGNTSATKYSISINGIKQGWGGEPSGAGIDYGSVDINFDDVPMNEPGTGLWQSPYVNQLALIQGINVTYGPGNPLDRWYNAIGGSINFVPIQPTNKSGGEVGATLGNYSTRGVYGYAQTGSLDGWSTVLAAGGTWVHSYRTNPDGFDAPSRAYTGFIKTRKTLDYGTLSFAAYSAKGVGFRPTGIPTSTIQGVTMNGVDVNGNPIPGPLYSQSASGYYSELPYGVWRKEDSDTIGLLYSKLNLKLSDITTLHNLMWYELWHRLHIHYNDFQQGQNNLYEYNNPFTRQFGDRMYEDLKLPYNTVSVGGSYMWSVYNSRQSFYNPNPPFNASQAVPSGHYRSNYWYLRNFAFFVQDAIKPAKTVTITPGVRYIDYQTDYVNNGAVDFAGADPAHNQGTLPNAMTNFSKVEPSIDLNWQTSPSVALYTNWAQTYRQPGNGGGGGPYQSILASTLQLEQGTDLQAGVKMHILGQGILQDFFMQANGYDLRFSNQIIGITNQAGTYQTSAFGSSDYTGFNLYIDNAFAYNVHGFLNLSLENAHFNSYDLGGGLDYAGLPVSYVPHTTVNLGVYTDYAVGNVDWNPRVWYQYTGSQHMFDDSQNIPSSREMPAYGLLNAALMARIPTSSGAVKEWDVGLTVLNLLNKQYNNFEWISSGGYFVVPQSAGAVIAYPGSPRTVFLTAAAKF
jgi:iron complex outermembrane receptor protein